MSRPVLLALSGSLRQHSYSTAILIALGKAAADRAEVRLHPLADVPLYNEDLDTASPPGGVATSRFLLSGLHGLLRDVARLRSGDREAA